MRLGKKIVILLPVAFAAIQFIQPARNKSGQVMPTDISNTLNIPPLVDTLLKTSCYDCHSNNTNYPWYANLQPLGWILNKHILKAKMELNFSDFGSYSSRRQRSKLKSIASQVNDNTMPLASYTWLHKNSKFSKEAKALINDWALKSIETIATGNKK
ncbi:MAG: hypothetical protein B7Y15_12695 [Bacteroidetes bacterium 24-39-8]|jgi:hypothetical protein|nr:MAG: hypothetical protein CFE25_10675 [Chitinophagaceae bacterium BSSC1]OYY05577.1 MAG: hypothetical protein B7Y76_00925 [Sphingobacteriia bacterium 35-40-5]OYZ48082.1 MAG: hypothetical protein B7Y15_12695 [Bacteroidetes bacterium 24-39-8]OZA56241.1 MAG: hypothetical protein B7X75_06595 [Sphingobacteriales bacterium 39-40-5]HQS04068.1 heme-binding domain-containing protein [Daejeonella sp.]